MMITVDAVSKVIREHNMVESGDRVVVGVSGGADSMCLLFLMSQLRNEFGFSLEAVHVHHCIRGSDADGDAEYVREQCNALKVPFRLVKEDVPAFSQENSLSEEEAGRIIRYRSFRESRPDKIAVAHHAEDSAETTLFNLFRGSGLKGLSGIKPVSGDIIRPLIFFTRAEIEEYCAVKGIAYRRDETNEDRTYARNRIRKNIIPEAEKINNRAVNHVLEAAEKISEAWKYIDDETERIFNRRADLSALPGKLTLDIRGIDETDRFLRTLVIKKCMIRLSGREKDITAVHVGDTEGLIWGVSGRKQSLPYGITAMKSFDSLVFIKNEAEAGAGDKYEKNEIPFDVREGKGEIAVRLPGGDTVRGAIVGREDLSYEKDDSGDSRIKNLRYTKWLDYDKIKGNAVWRTRRPGDRISISGGSKKLKDLLIEEKIPADERDVICFLVAGSEVIWVPGLRIGSMFRITDETRRILKVSMEKG